ncbi:methionyl-tRNA formyltransferase [Rugosibacter aromaticivorans]|uniref:Methionyl-tRNA formyltransferase n=1 Tax=Rugosibacter aromaticivorans TaxID=1565605 RepID=A0A0C5JPP8_9PROT|nr:methionyl-tRNA formyltransferase [Rugosibacter aromaticivorans]AJP49266.1 methionyl-tRNA formyltransferase [Rugosibacter aromaticivorans]
MRIIFAGTPDFAAQALAAILAAGHDVPLVLTQPDRPAGRGLQLQPSAVKQLALAHSLPVFQPERLKDPATHEPMRAAFADVMVVVAYGLILPQAVLDIPRHGCLNIHASLLPRWRGAAPIQRAIEAGDKEAGVTIMQMEAGLDTGAMLLAEKLEIGAEETAGELHDRLSTLGARLIVAALAQRDALTPKPQSATGTTYAAKISKAEAQLDWTQPADVLARKIRAFNPFPGATLPLAGELIKVWRAEAVEGCGSPGQILAADADGIVIAASHGALRLIELQKPGGRRLTSADFLRGSPLLLE